MPGSHISLFAGVGMTDLAVERAGFKAVATAEVDPFCRTVLQRRFPAAVHFEDVRHVAPPLTVPRPLLVSGGFPCQDVSSLGQGTGVTGGKRSGLWAEFARVIEDFRPDYVLIENSPMLRSRGLDVVLCDLVRLGYNARWDCIPAAAAGAPHLRDRIFIVAWKRAEDHCPWWAAAKWCVRTYHDYIIPTQGASVKVTRFPRAGTMVGRFIREDKTRFTHKAAKALAARPMFPTPRAAANEWRTTRNAPTHGNGHGATLAGTLNDLERAAGRTPAPSSESAGNINPAWVEWLMGLPLGWTDLRVRNDKLLPHPGWQAEPAIPRTLADASMRRARLHALGNGLVPQAAALALDMLELS